MQNLLRTLRERERQNGYSNTDLKRVLADVKAERVRAQCLFTVRESDVPTAS